MIAEPLEKGLAEDIKSEVVQIGWSRSGVYLMYLVCGLAITDFVTFGFDLVYFK